MIDTFHWKSGQIEIHVDFTVLSHYLRKTKTCQRFHDIHHHNWQLFPVLKRILTI